MRWALVFLAFFGLLIVAPGAQDVGTLSRSFIALVGTGMYYGVSRAWRDGR